MTDPNVFEILLVEDNPDDAEMTIRALRENNLSNRLLHVEDGTEALEFIFAEGTYASRQVENGPKVILLDLKLRRVNGIEVLRRVKSDPRTRSIPVVVMTSSKEERDVVETYQMGVNSYIVKPVAFEPFVAAVAQLGLYWMLLNQPPR
jgi:CheY-like chemotaxis protein